MNRCYCCQNEREEDNFPYCFECLQILTNFIKGQKMMKEEYDEGIRGHLKLN